MKISLTIQDDVVCKNLSKYLKEKFNLKLVGLIRYILLHPEIIEQIDKQIDPYDRDYRFVNKME